MMRLSILIPNFNGGSRLRLAVESCRNLRICHDDFEVVVIDNRSTDNSLEILQELRGDFPPLKTFVNTENIGRIGNWNACLKQSNGTYIMFLFANDTISDQNNIEDILDILDNDQSISLVVSAFTMVEGTERSVRRSYDHQMIKYSSKELIPLCLNHGVLPFGVIQSIVYRNNEIKSELASFDENIPITADQVFTFEQAAKREYVLFNPHPQINWVLSAERFHKRINKDDAILQEDIAIQSIAQHLAISLDEQLLMSYRSIGTGLGNSKMVVNILALVNFVFDSMRGRRKVDRLMPKVLLEKVFHPGKDIYELLVGLILKHCTNRVPVNLKQ